MDESRPVGAECGATVSLDRAPGNDIGARLEKARA
jgi:hypothetical protein